MDITKALISTGEDQQEQSSLKDMMLSKLQDVLISTDDIDIKTDLTPRQIVAITKGKLYAQTFGIQLVADLCKLNETLLVSKKRAGRQELIEMSKSIMSSASDSEAVDWRKRLFG